MPTGTKLLQLILYVLGIHSGAITISNVIDWTDSNFQSYLYRNPKLLKEQFDKYSDLKNITDPTAKYRLEWHTNRFYKFYFVSIFLLLTILFLKMYLMVN